MRLAWKKAVVTWWASWIWLATCELFSKEWAEVFITDVNKEAWIKAEKWIKNSKFIYLNVWEEDSWVELFKEIWEIDIIVNNAWIIWNPEKMWSQTPEDISVESWDLVHKINLAGVMLWCKYAIKNMKKSSSASIINMASRSWKIGVPLNCAYASSKAAIINHTKSVALHCSDMWYKIRCNAVSPAAIMTDMWEMMIWWDEKVYKQLCEDIPMNRFWTPEEVAKSCLFLASDDSSYITWAEINIDWWILAWSKTSPK